MIHAAQASPAYLDARSRSPSNSAEKIQEGGLYSMLLLRFGLRRAALVLRDVVLACVGDEGIFGVLPTVLDVSLLQKLAEAVSLLQSLKAHLSHHVRTVLIDAHLSSVLVRAPLLGSAPWPLATLPGRIDVPTPAVVADVCRRTCAVHRSALLDGDAVS